MRTPQEIMERRTKMLTLKSQGVPLRDIVTELSNKYGLSKTALYIDWSKRRQWAGKVAQLSDKNLIDEMIIGLRKIIQNAWFEYTTSPNPSIKLGSLRLAKETYVELISIMQSMGYAVKVPEAIEIGLKWLAEDSDNKIQPT